MLLFLLLFSGATPPNFAAAPDADPSAAPPSTFVYRTLGERQLQLAAHYPPGWKQTDRRPAVLFFSGSHKVQPDKNGVSSTYQGPGTFSGSLAIWSAIVEAGKR